MSDIVLLDTSIYLNILDVPGFNKDREEVFANFKTRISNSDYFILPLITVLEAGNHIGQLSNGSNRRKYSIILVEDVLKAIKGELPYQTTTFPSREEFTKWVTDFSGNKQHISIGDHLIIKEWDHTCKITPLSRVLIWSLDNHLRSYDRNPTRK